MISVQVMSQTVSASDVRRFGLRLLFLWDLVFIGFLMRSMMLWSDVAREDVQAIGSEWPGLALTGVFVAALVFARHHKRKSERGVSSTLRWLLIAAVWLAMCR